MILFPNSKINIGLRITGKRADGYHDLETVFYPLPINDIIEIIPSDRLTFTASGLPVPGSQQDNLCVKAWELMKAKFPDLPFVDIYLYKHIPLGAGLGGGSADGAFMLQLLNDQFSLGLNAEALAGLALQLGSDCPFFIFNKPCLAKGRGEIMEPVQLNLSAYSVALIHPGIHISTAWAFSQIRPAKPLKPLAEIIRQPVHEWKEELLNDFEQPVMEQYPALREIKKKLYEAGALYASMTGSGSAFYGIFEKNSIPFSEEKENQLFIIP